MNESSLPTAIILACITGIVFLNGLQLNSIEDKLSDDIMIYEYPKAIDPATGADSALIEQCNFFVEENVRLENYIIQLERDNQIMGSALAEKEN
jgi:hypothetical protein